MTGSDGDEDDARDRVRHVEAMMAEQTGTATEEERAAVRTWQSTDRHYRHVQQAVRHPDRPASAEAKQTMEGLDSLIGRGAGLTEDVTVWRGIRSATSTFRVPSERLEDLIGTAVAPGGYLPTSLLRSEAEEFTAPAGHGGPVLMRLVAPKGTPAAWVPPLGRAELAYQAELLFDARTGVIIDSVERVGDIVIVVGRLA